MKECFRSHNTTFYPSAQFAPSVPIRNTKGLWRAKSPSPSASGSPLTLSGSGNLTQPQSPIPTRSPSLRDPIQATTLAEASPSGGAKAATVSQSPVDTDAAPENNEEINDAEDWEVETNNPEPSILEPLVAVWKKKQQEVLVALQAELEKGADSEVKEVLFEKEASVKMYKTFTPELFLGDGGQCSGVYYGKMDDEWFAIKVLRCGFRVCYFSFVLTLQRHLKGAKKRQH